MARDQIITAIDIGSQKIRTAIGIYSDNKNTPLNIIGIGVSDSDGMRKGAVIDLEGTTQAIIKSLEDAERMAGEPVGEAFIGIGGIHLNSYSSKGVIAISNSKNEITEDDVMRSLEAAETMTLPANQKIIKTIPRYFSIDDQEGITDPVGMTGIRLEVEAHIISGSTPIIRNLEKTVHEAGVGILDFIPNSLAASESVLTRRQKELGVIILDIGSGSTSVAVFEEGNITHVGTIPLGGEAITNDIAIGLRTSIDTAERIKIEYGHSIPKEIGKRETIDLSTISRIDTHEISRYQLANIIEARLQEIFHLVRLELKKIKRDSLLPAGAILTGGVAKTPDIVDLTRDSLNLPVQIGFPEGIEGVAEQIDDPSYATVLGELLYGIRYGEQKQKRSISIPGINFGNILASLKSFGKKLLP